MSRSVTERKEVLDAAREEAQRVKGVLTKGKQDATTANGVKRATSDEHLQKRSKLIRPAAQLIDRDEHRTTSTTKYSIFNIPLVRDPPSYSRTTANPRQLDSLYPYLLYHHGSPSGRRPQSACMANVSHPNNHLKTNNHSKSNPSAAGNERRVNHRRAASWSGDTSTYPDQFQRCSTTLPPLQEHTKWISYRELEILHRLPQHPRIPRIKDVTSISGGYRMIAFPYENVRAFITSRAEACTSSLRLKWCIQAAEAVAFLHKFGITHGDVLPAHFLLDEMLDIKISSFHAATTTEEAAAPSVIEQRYRHPWASFGMAMQEHDVFALGGVIYFIQTGKDPFEALDLAEVERRYEEGTFPDVDGLEMGSLILNCWKDEVSAADVHQILSASCGAANVASLGRAVPEGRTEDANDAKQGKGHDDGTSRGVRKVRKPVKSKTPDAVAERLLRQVDRSLKLLDQDDAATTN